MRIQLPPETEEPRARPAGAGDLSRDHGKGAVALAAPLDPIGMDEGRVGETPCHSRKSRVPGLNEIGGAGLTEPRLSGSAPACSSFRAVAVERPPYARS